MKAYYIFSDECGQYKKERRESFILSHPFYVRSTVMIELDDYISLTETIERIKTKYSIPSNNEIKWSHLGNLIKNNPPDYLQGYSLTDFQECIEDILKSVLDFKSIILFFSLTDNKEANRVDDIKMIKMHLQNMLQRVQHEMKDKDSYATVIVDDLNSQSKTLKKACYSMMQEGDFVSYENIRKSILIDISEQCAGLQISDLCAGVFTASLKYLKFNGDARFKYAYDLLSSVIYKKTRSISIPFGNNEVYRFGVREVPDGSGTSLAKNISAVIAELLNTDEHEDMRKIMEEFQR